MFYEGYTIVIFQLLRPYSKETHVYWGKWMRRRSHLHWYDGCAPVRCEVVVRHQAVVTRHVCEEDEDESSESIGNNGGAEQEEDDLLEKSPLPQKSYALIIILHTGFLWLRPAESPGAQRCAEPSLLSKWGELEQKSPEALLVVPPPPNCTRNYRPAQCKRLLGRSRDNNFHLSHAINVNTGSTHKDNTREHDSCRIRQTCGTGDLMFLFQPQVTEIPTALFKGQTGSLYIGLGILCILRCLMATFGLQKLHNPVILYLYHTNFFFFLSCEWFVS